MHADESGPAVEAIESEPCDAPPAPAPCRGDCEQAFEAAVIALEDTAARLGFRLLNVALEHTRCGKSRASATDVRRRTRELLRKRDRLLHGEAA